MKTIIKEETKTTRRSANPVFAALDAQERDRAARERYPKFFDSDAHVDRVVAVDGIIRGFFRRNPTYHQARFGYGGKPFEVVKLEDCGHEFPRRTTAEKQQLYGQLDAMPNVKWTADNGHFLVRIY